MVFAALHDPDLVAIGGIGAAVATIILASFAFFQMRATQAQVTTMEQSAKDQIKALQEATDKELDLVRKQIAASTEQNKTAAAAARAQLQPIVFAHGWGDPKKGPPHAPEGKVRVDYYLSNEGVGPALDVEHGISVGGVESTPNDAGSRYRTMSVGETAPPEFPNPSTPVRFFALGVVVLNTEPDLVYWARFSNVFGDRFEVLNYPEASRPAVFRPLPSPDQDQNSEVMPE